MAPVSAWQIIELAVLIVPGFLILWRVMLCRGRPQGPGLPALPPYSVIIPARNEESRLPPLLASLRAQTVPPAEIIVVDDGSTDGTAALALGAGCRVVAAGGKPQQWLGKTWACWVGAERAATKRLLFLDADTRLEAAGCERLLTEREERGGVLTVQPWHAVGSWVESLSAFFNVVVMAAINSFTVFGKRLAPAGCFGPCILCTREDYVRVDGHRSVKESILEDVDLGRRFLAAGVPVRCRGGKGTISYRMYPGGIRDLVDGWSKNMASGAQGARPIVLCLVALWISGCASASFFGARWLVSGNTAAALTAMAFYVLYAGQAFWMFRRIGSFGLHSAFLFPIHLVFFAAVFVRSLVLTFLLRRVSWKGRRIDNPVRARKTPYTRNVNPR
ncbi:MAG TPA: glycosyltransferase [Spirochaetia bacterium]|nr:glycosyltransferase [Spirochaetia bacterium]